MRTKISLLVGSIVTSTIAPSVWAAEQSGRDLFDLSLEQLLNVKVTSKAAITQLDDLDSPAAITVITQQQIQNSTARNIYDLMEFFVPGAFWMNHEEGPHLGIRGNIVNRNYKFLLLVNNRLMNNKAFFGAKSELEQWDLSDIKQIEVVRGPGSVTYGPGAIAGVINIITYQATDAQASNVQVNYNHEYESTGVAVNHWFKVADYDFYQHLSIRTTEGIAPRNFLVTRDNELGLIGRDVLIGDVPLDYFNDYHDDPQIKWHLDWQVDKDWRVWARYTQQGSSWRGNEVKTDFNGRLLNQQSMRDRQFTLSAEQHNEISDDIAFNGFYSYDSYDVERRIERQRDPDPENPLNFRQNYAEDELFLRGVINWKTSDSTEIAFGAEYSYERFGAGWGDSIHDMRLGEDGNIVSGPGSRAIRAGNGGSADDDGTEIFIGNGWETDTLSLYTESNIVQSDDSRWLFSIRFDKNSYSDWMFSPRIAYITNLDDQSSLKTIVQRSNRMNTAGQLLSDDVNQRPADEETMNGIEVIYETQIDNELRWAASVFYNDQMVIGWDGDENRTRFLGDLSVYGMEFELARTESWGQWGVNASYVKQHDWQLASGVLSSGISYSDYNLEVGDGIQTGFGDDLNNWPNLAVKFFSQYRLSDDLIIHADARYFSEMTGARDGWYGLRAAVADTDDEQAVNEVIGDLESHDVYGSDFRVNLSLQYLISQNLELTLGVQNLIGSNENRRYSYDTGNDDPAPRRVRYIEEPRFWQLRLTYNY